jgi:SPFH domain / Band 7 family.
MTGIAAFVGAPARAAGQGFVPYRCGLCAGRQRRCQTPSPLPSVPASAAASRLARYVRWARLGDWTRPKEMGLKTWMQAVAMVTVLGGCTVVSPDVGQEAVLVDRPWIFGKGGVRLDDVRKTGRSYTWLSTEKIYVDTTPQTIKVAFNDYSSSDNILLDFETAIQYRITNSPRLLSTKGVNWFENNIRSQYSAIVRDQVKRHDMTSMMSKPETAPPSMRR